MPYLCAKLSTAPSAQISGAIATALTDLTAELLKKKKQLTSVSIEQVSAPLWFIGGQSIASQDFATFYLDIKVTEGTNTKDEKAAYIGKVFAAVESLIGKLHPASYIVIHEVPADAWGYEGITQEFRYVKGKTL